MLRLERRLKRLGTTMLALILPGLAAVFWLQALESGAKQPPLRPAGQGISLSVAAGAQATTSYPISNQGSQAATYSFDFPGISQTIDSNGVGMFPSLALDSAGQPAIAYHASSSADLRYAAGPAWLPQAIDQGGQVGFFPSLALDGDDRPWISYGDLSDSSLRLATLSGTTWMTQVVDAAAGGGFYSSLALDDAGNPSISYYDSVATELKFAAFDGSSWSLQTVDSAGDVGQYSSLALDASGQPHISYYDAGNSQLKYASFTGSSWSSETVDNSGDVGQFSALALFQGEPAISYYDAGNGALKLARQNGGLWSSETVDSSGDAGQWSSLAFDSSGAPHISYTTIGPQRVLRLAALPAGGSSTWLTRTLDAGGTMEWGTSLLLDGEGRAHIAYHDSAGVRRLLYRAPSAVPWLQFSPALVTLGPGESAAVSLTFDATALAAGSYTTTLELASSDPAAPLTSVPVTLTVIEAWNVFLPLLDG